jgi:putative transposase
VILLADAPEASVRSMPQRARHAVPLRRDLRERMTFALISAPTVAAITPLHRRAIRFKSFDYSQAACYFVTICAHGKQSLFGIVRESKMQLNMLGKIVHECLMELPYHFANVETPVHAIMPNHLHGIFVLRDRARHAVPLQFPREAFGNPVAASIPTIVRSFKGAVTRKARLELRSPALDVWQRNYFERVIRNDDEFRKTWQYICENPARWDFDSENPQKKV